MPEAGPKVPRLRCVIAALAAVGTCAACTSSTTSTTTPDANKCQFTVTNVPMSFTPAGGSGSLSISTSRDCGWTVASGAAWVSITGSSQGQGPATIAYTVAANPAPSVRTAALTAADEQIQLSQAAAACTFSLSRTSDTLGSSGGQLSVGVSTLTGCSWNAASQAAWIGIVSGQSGTASGTVVLSATANTGASRSGTVNIAGQIYTISEDAAPAPPTSPTPPGPPAPTPPTPPGPAPPPFVSQPITLDGNISGLGGHCPNVSFTVQSHSVAASGSTQYQHGNCSDLSNGDHVHVMGSTQANGSVAANSIQEK